MRDTFEGTPYDLAKQQPAAGPFGCPDRYDSFDYPRRPTLTPVHGSDGEDLIRKFWNEHDPMPFEFTGYQYRSAVWCHTPTQEAVVGAVRGQLNSRKTAPTAIGEAGPFYRAEEYHQQFIAKQTMRVGI